MAKFTVSRKTWYRGLTSQNSRLLRDDGTRCCIGFVAQQCDIPDDAILDKSDVAGAKIKSGLWPKWFLNENGQTDDLYEAYITNDSVHITESEREEKLIKLFAKHGDIIEFVD